MNAFPRTRVPASWFVRTSIALHLVAAALLVFRLDLWVAVLSIVVLDHLGLVWGSLWPRSRWVGRNVRRLGELDVRAPAVALTFDDGPDPEVTPAVLEILRDHGARATFFCIGRQANRHPELIRRIVAEGHTVENHTDRHPHTFCFFPRRRMAAEIDRAQQLLEGQAGRAPRYFRAPAGLRNPWLDRILADRGLLLVSWTRRAFDTRTRSPQRIVQRLAPAVAGDILLLHDGSSAKTEGGRPVVLEALPAILDELRSRNLDVRGLPESGRYR